MNKTTRAIKDKGYSLEEFCRLNFISLRTYRRYEKNDYGRRDKLKQMIDELGVKNG